MIKDRNLIKDLIKTIIFMFVGFVVALLLHELSHLFVLLLCNGQLVDFRVGSQNFVSGYIDPKYVSFVALSSIIIPSLLSAIFIFVKSTKLASINISVAIHCIINIVGGLICITTDTMDLSWDLVLAYNYSNQILSICVAIIFLIINIVNLLLSMRKIITNF